LLKKIYTIYKRFEHNIKLNPILTQFMIIQIRSKLPFILAFTSMLLLSACMSWDSFTTYFNTYYNIERITKECEDEFEFHDEKLRILPRVFAVEQDFVSYPKYDAGPPPFMSEFIVKQQKRQPVAVKLDSILIKGSKILAKHPKGEYAEGSLFHMAKAYFYKEEWLPAELKCAEAIDLFPTGKFSPDNHLLYSKALLIERKFYEGKIMLSRTVDIAWKLERYDILSEAFRLQAELSLYENNLEEAQRPYRQAILQSESKKMKAKWQIDLAALLYRLGLFEKAEVEFANVFKYSPDYVGMFEAYMYRASCLNRLGRYEEADKLHKIIETDGKFTEWKGYAFVERMTQFRLKAKDTLYPTTAMGLVDTTKYPKVMELSEKYADTAFVGNDYILVYQFERGADNYLNNDYDGALKYFAKSRTKRTPIYQTSFDMFKILSEWKQVIAEAIPRYNTFQEQGGGLSDTVRWTIADALFRLGRIHEVLRHQDSVIHYYSLALEVSPSNMNETARYIHAYARVIRPSDPFAADSLTEILADDFPYTDYGKDAMITLGKTENFLIDPVEELFSSGTQLRKTGQYKIANHQYLRIYNEYPDSKYAPRGLYAIGYIFERSLEKYDSAAYYYKLLIAKYPDSEYAKEVGISLAFFENLVDGKPLPDSLLKATPLLSPITGETLLIDPNMEKPLIVMPEDVPEPFTDTKSIDIKDNEGGLFDMIKDPSKMLEKGKEMFQQELNNYSSPSALDPSKLIPQDFTPSGDLKPATPPDSTKRIGE